MKIQSMELLNKKVDDSKKIIREAFEKYDPKDILVAWTGGKDSTLVLWIMLQVCHEDDVKVPKCFCIDEGDMFDEIRSFLEEWSKKWGADVDIIHNSDVSKAAGGKLGAIVKIKDLNERNQREVARLGYDEIGRAHV